jgi:hypothetical protein
LALVGNAKEPLSYIRKTMQVIPPKPVRYIA